MLQDVRLALRRLARSPAWTLSAVTVLALGLGLGVTLFAVTDALVFEPPRVAEPDRLLSVFAGGGTGRSGVTDYEPMAYPDVRDLRRASRSFRDLTAYAPTTVTLETDADGFGSVAEVVERNYFDVLGLAPSAGRFFAARDDSGTPEAGACDVAVLGWDLHRRLGESPRLRVNGRPVRAVGVAPKNFRGLMRGLEPEIWLPMDCARELRFDAARNVGLGRATPGLDRFEDRGLRWVWAVGRLRDGVTAYAAGIEISSLAERFARVYPGTNRDRRFLTSSTADLRLAPDVDRRLEHASTGLLTVALCVLLVACGNVASLLLVRSRARRREMAARRALGAGTLRILRLLWIEGATLAALGVAGAVGLASVAALALDRLRLPVPIPVELGASVDAEVVLTSIAAAFAASLLFVSAPVLEHLRADLVSALRTGVGVTGRRSSSLLATSVVFQIAVSMALWIVAATAGDSLLRTQRMDPGCRPEGVVTARFDLGLQGFSAAERTDVHGRAAEEVRRLPGVRNAAYASHLPLSMELLLSRVALRPGATEAQSLAADRADVGVGYFETLGVELLAGRGFTTEERDDELPVAVVNLKLARDLWSLGAANAGDALGREFWQSGRSQPLRVVGVARTGKYRSLSEETRPFFYRPLALRAAGSRILMVRSDGPAPLEPVGRALSETEPRLIVHRLETAEQAMAASLFVPRVASTLLAACSTLTLALTAAGLYGVLGLSVARRRREIGIRMALGGAPSRVAAQAVGGRLAQVLVGLVAGLVVGLWLAARLAGFLPVGGAWQARSAVAAAAVVLTVSCLAALLPARRAARTDPAVVLYSE